MCQFDVNLSHLSNKNHGNKIFIENTRTGCFGLVSNSQQKKTPKKHILINQISSPVQYKAGRFFCEWCRTRLKSLYQTYQPQVPHPGHDAKTEAFLGNAACECWKIIRFNSTLGEDEKIVWNSSCCKQKVIKQLGVFPFWHDQKEHSGISQVTSTNGEVASSEANATKWCSLAAFLLQHLFDLKYQCTNKQPRERSAVSKKQVKQHIRTKFLYHCGPYLQHHCDTTNYSSYRYSYVASHGSLQECSTWSTCMGLSR